MTGCSAPLRICLAILCKAVAAWMPSNMKWRRDTTSSTSMHVAARDMRLFTSFALRDELMPLPSLPMLLPPLLILSLMLPPPLLLLLLLLLS